MRFYVAAGLIVICAASFVGAQDTKPGDKPSKPTSKPLTLVGCVSGDEANPGQVTFIDEKSGTVYRLSGTDAREYVGRRVQIIEVTDSKKMKFRGGLVPSPNTAAQAGSIDPTETAMAGQGATTRGVGTGELPEFRVKSVKPLAGACPQK